MVEEKKVKPVKIKQTPEDLRYLSFDFALQVQVPVQLIFLLDA